MLVGGDVHRTRVILHPVRALAGYDAPEFITSPLAQNVIAANKVDVPCLLFDAGESHSCMFLTATGHGQDAELVACFQNGEGREFYRRRFWFANWRLCRAERDREPRVAPAGRKTRRIVKRRARAGPIPALPASRSAFP